MMAVRLFGLTLNEDFLKMFIKNCAINLMQTLEKQNVKKN